MTVLTAGQTQVNQGDPVTLTAAVTVNGQPALGGQVRFLDGKHDLGTVQVVVSGTAIGTATLRTRSLRAGSNSLSAVFSGAPNSSQASAPSQSPLITVTVIGAPIPVASMSLAGTSPSLNAIVTGTRLSPIGSVSFVDSTTGSSLGSADLVVPKGQGLAGALSSLSTGGTGAPCIGDFNQDGTLDVAVSGNSSVGVLLGNPSEPGQYLSEQLYPVGGSPIAIVTGDFNGDGWPDLATANSDGSVSVLFGTPGQPSHFLSATTYQTGNASNATLVVADFNGDGLLDLAAVGTQTVVLMNTPGSPGTFAVGSPSPPSGAAAIAVGDFNGDGYPDLAAITPYSLQVYYANPSSPGQFQTTGQPLISLTPPSPSDLLSAVVAADFNGDHIPDIAVASSPASGSNVQTSHPGTVTVFLGSTSQLGAFSAPVVYQTGAITALTAMDLNGEGTLDLFAMETEYTSIPTPWAPICCFPSGSWASVLPADPTDPGHFLADSQITGTAGAGPSFALTTGDLSGTGFSNLVFVLSDGIHVVLLESSATATLSNAFISPTGSQTIVATYSGDSSYESATASLQVKISPPPTPTATNLTASALYVTAGQNMTLTATTTETTSFGNIGVTSGTVTFYEGTTTLASVPVNAYGIATFTTNSLAVGFHPISASYGQSDNWLPSTSATLNIDVAQPAQTPGGLLFVPVTPCRLMDTRGNGFSGVFGAPSLVGGSSRDVPIPQSACGIPSNAMAYALNITAVPEGPLGYLSVWPTGLLQPTVSTLNSWDGRVIANAAIVPAGASGSITLYASNPTDVVLDINGYFTQEITANALAFYPVTPCRVADTRGNGFTGPFGQPSIAAGSDRSFPVQQSACGIPASAQAYSLNFTVVPSGPLYYLTAWPSGQPQPYVSTLNSWTGDVVANAAIVPAGSNGGIDVFATNNTDVVIDINGYFAPPGGTGALLFYPLTPCRMVDTRGNGFTGSFGPPSLVGDAGRTFALASSTCGTPSGTQAYSLNVTVIPPAPLAYLTIWPAGQTQPTVSTLNSWRGEVVANAAVVPAGANGALTVYASDPTDLLIDLNGVFAP